MKAVYVKEYGTLENLEYGDLPDPVPGPNEVVVDVKFAGVNFPDLLIIQGLYQFKPDPPFSPGGEVAGTVSALGDQVKGFNIGDVVMAAAPFGAYAEKMCVEASNVYQLPDSISLEHAAVLQETYATGIHALMDRGQSKAGERLLVLGAAGGTGVAALQIGKAMGLEVVAAASTNEKLDFCKSNGADHLINYKDSDLKDELKKLGGVDLVFDPVGGKLSEAAFRGLRPNGRHLVIGFTAGTIPAIPWNLPLLKQASVVGVFWGGFWRTDPAGNRRNVEQLISWLDEKKISPQITTRYPLAEASKALVQIGSRKALGKILLEV